MEGSYSTSFEGSVLGYIFAFFGLLLFARLPGLPPGLLAGLTLPLLPALTGLSLFLLFLTLLSLGAFALYALRLVGFLFLIHKSLSSPWYSGELVFKMPRYKLQDGHSSSRCSRFGTPLQAKPSFIGDSEELNPNRKGAPSFL